MNSAASKEYGITVLLVDDQKIIGEVLRRMLLDEHDITFHFCQESKQALATASQCSPTVILQDLVMPDADGLDMVRMFRNNPDTKDVPIIVLSSKEDAETKVKSFENGANDYLVKLPNKLELIARIRHQSQSYIHLLQRNEAFKNLKESQAILNSELSEAADYVKNLIPPAEENKFFVSNWIYIPSTSLGGDSMGYHWVDSEHLAMYLIDVCGHGVGAALLSISVINVLRSQTLTSTNFLRPHYVLDALNATFPMEKNNNMFFTIWYGVYSITKRQITYSTAGHPPAILLTGASSESFEVRQLGTTGLVIGADIDSEYQSFVCNVDDFNKLYVFSDGIVEITKADERVVTLNEMIDVLKADPEMAGIENLNRILQAAKELNASEGFDDDYSVMQFQFKK